MGKGDSRTKRGKIFRGSYGKTRPHKKKRAESTTQKEDPRPAPRPAPLPPPPPPASS